MKTILRNFLSILKRFKMATVLNILGLSVAFAAFIVIFMQLDYDRNFDRMHKDADCIFRVEVQWGKDGTQAIINRPLANLFMTSSPHILAGTLLDWGRDFFYTVEVEETRHNYQDRVVSVYPEFAQVFSLDMIEGSEEALKEPEKVLIPLSLAQKMFGNNSAIGQTLKGRSDSYTVGGVYRDFARNSLVNNIIYRLMPKDENINNKGNWNYEFYILLDNPGNAAGLMDNFKRITDPSVMGESFSWEESNFNLRLTPLSEVHYTTDVTYDRTPKSSRQTLLVLFAIAIVILIIAGINFTNFSTALTPMRIKSINTQKVLGEEDSLIRRLLISEAIVISTLSYLIALVFIAVVPFSPIVSLLDAEVSFSAHAPLIALTGLIAILTGLLAGVYPAYYMTSFPPALVLKGDFGLSPKGRKLKSILIGIQFIASFALIIGSLFMYLQNYYMQNTPLGYDKDQIIITNMNWNVNKSQEAFSSQLKSFSGIEDVTYSEPLLSSSDQYMGWGRKFKDEDIQYQCLPVHFSFLKVMNVEIKEGRNFRQEDTNTRHGVYIFNQKAKDMYNMEVGEMIDSAAIIGFMPDVKFASFRTEVVPMAFYVWGTQNWGNQPNNAYIKVKAGSDMRGAIDHVRFSLKTFDPEYPFNVRFFDEVLNGLYEKEQKLSSLITLFSLIAIFISIVGVFGLVVFDSEYKKKEIGLRKVMGSTTEQILVLFNKLYIRILCICFILAAPLAWYAVSRWLENFAYKTPMYWWVYPTAFFIVFIITICTVTFQNWRAANENPVNSIKNE